MQVGILNSVSSIFSVLVFSFLLTLSAQGEEKAPEGAGKGKGNGAEKSANGSGGKKGGAGSGTSKEGEGTETTKEGEGSGTKEVKPKNPIVVFKVEIEKDMEVEFEVELFPKKTPKTVANFLKYSKDKYFDGTIFHRVVKNFMIQGGGFKALGMKKAAGLRDPIENEADRGISNKKFTIAMARTVHPHSATSQFFINTKDNPALDHRNKGQGWGYCAFGRVIKGTDAVEKIANIQVEGRRMGGGQEFSKPLNPPKILSVKLKEPDKPKQSPPENNQPKMQTEEPKQDKGSDKKEEPGKDGGTKKEDDSGAKKEGAAKKEGSGEKGAAPKKKSGESGSGAKKEGS